MAMGYFLINTGCHLASSTDVQKKSYYPNLVNYKIEYEQWYVPCVLCPCLTQVAKDCWKFLFCWNVTGVPILVVSTTLVPGVPWPDSEPTMTLDVAAGVVEVPVEVAVADPGFCSRRFYDWQQRQNSTSVV